MLVFFLSVFFQLNHRGGGNSIITIQEKEFWMKDVRDTHQLIVAGKIEDTAYIQFYDGEKQIAEVKNSVNSYTILLDNTVCTSTGFSKYINNVDFNWIWITWDKNKLIAGPGKVPDGSGTSRLGFTALPTTVVFVSHLGKSEWKFDEPILYQNLYTKTEGRRGGVVGQRMKSVSALACIARCTQMNQCAAVNFSPYSGVEEDNCEIISYKAKFELCNRYSPNKLTSVNSNTGDASWNQYVKL